MECGFSLLEYYGHMWHRVSEIKGPRDYKRIKCAGLDSKTTLSLYSSSCI